MIVFRSSVFIDVWRNCTDDTGEISSRELVILYYGNSNIAQEQT